MYGKEGKRAKLRERAKDVLNQNISVVLLQNNFKEYSITEQKIPKANFVTRYESFLWMVFLLPT